MSALELSQHPLSEDSYFSGIIDRLSLTSIRPRESHLRALAHSIISQQLSIKAADTIITRTALVVDLSDPKAILDADSVDLRNQGISRPKLRYLRALADHHQSNPDLWKNPEHLSDDQLLSELTSITGVGLWTAQLFLMFQLQRPDIFPARDLILQRAVGRWFALPNRGRARERAAESIAQRWAPHRSLASRLLWKWESQSDNSEL